ncbi:2Fe-2S iron-sulfur cluster-binding protein [Zavarzinia compransoris]|uniref:2Fe-2S iron-sulfur cluster-binding protein n=1 Tax=Zavarzinia marina TaxID=2911065 RepID=UPI001F1B884B|nr:2Fe-2S iron-sulfur cluster-binding protein [Zavarzinia marina]MCF4167299.1 2Fe-2S iron-sulfur cluster-binding protein [Zavarzinia marina]
MSSITVTFIQMDGVHRTLDAPCGQTLMEIGRACDVRGILGECGGAGSCGTCRVVVEDAAFRALVGEAEGLEVDLLSFFDDNPPGTRLACQITLDPALNHLTVRVPQE